MAEPGKRTYRPRAERRAEIIDRAIEVFGTDGVNASLRDIGDAIGVSHAALRYHFPTREALLIEVYREYEARHAANDEPGTRAVGIMDRSHERNARTPGFVELYTALLAQSLQPDGELTRTFIAERFARVRAQLAVQVRIAQDAGDVSAGIDAEAAASLVIAASDGLQVQWLLDPAAVDVRDSLAILNRLLPGG